LLDEAVCQNRIQPDITSFSLDLLFRCVVGIGIAERFRVNPTTEILQLKT
jgi:hypothetical protein